MRRILPSQHNELIPSFFANNEHVDGPIFFSYFVQDAIISKSKFP